MFDVFRNRTPTGPNSCQTPTARPNRQVPDRQAGRPLAYFIAALMRATFVKGSEPRSTEQPPCTIDCGRGGFMRWSAMNLDCAVKRGHDGRVERVTVKANKKPAFEVDAFLATVDGGRSVSNYRTNQKVFSQGDPA